MELRITPPKKLDIDEFVRTDILNAIPEVFLEIVDRTRLIRFDDYVNSLAVAPKTKTGKRRHMIVGDVLYGALHNLIVNVSNGVYTITINPDTKVPNFNIKMLTVAELVNFGTASVAPYPVIDEVFNTVADRMGDYYTQYLLERVKENGN